MAKIGFSFTQAPTLYLESYRNSAQQHFSWALEFSESSQKNLERNIGSTSSAPLVQRKSSPFIGIISGAPSILIYHRCLGLPINGQSLNDTSRTSARQRISSCKLCRRGKSFRFEFDRNQETCAILVRIFLMSYIPYSLNFVQPCSIPTLLQFYFGVFQPLESIFQPSLVRGDVAGFKNCSPAFASPLSCQLKNATAALPNLPPCLSM